MKKMIRITLMILISTTPLSLYAQTKIVFKESGQLTVPGVKATLTTSSNEVVFQGISDENGILAIPSSAFASSNELKLEARLTGFPDLSETISNGQNYSIAFGDRLLEHQEMVVTAQYEQKLIENAVHSIKIIDRKKMEAMGAVTLRDVLTNEQGIRLSHDIVLGTGLSMQGVSGQNVKILIDGVPVIGRQGGNIDLNQINLNTIERIEIVEGPLSVNFGTNALGGVINLITKKTPQNKIGATVNSYYESSGHYNINSSLRWARKNHRFELNIGRNFFDGWHETHSVFSNPTPIADSNRYMLWKPREQLFGGLAYTWNNRSWNIRYKGDAFCEKVWNRGYPRPPYQETAFDDEYQTWRINHSIQAQGKLGKHGKLQVLASYNDFVRRKNTYFTNLTTLDRIFSPTSSDHDTSAYNQYLSRGSYIWKKDSSKLELQVGYEVSFEQGSGKRIADGIRTQGDIALFSTAEYSPIERLTIRPGLRYAYNTTYTAPILPSLNLKWGLNDDFTIRASYARGFRAPGVKELYFEFNDINHNIIGNDSLEAETSSNYVLSFHYGKKLEKSRITMSFKGFYNDIQNLISLAQVTGTIDQFTYLNVDDFQSAGGNFSITWQTKALNWKSTLGYIGRSNAIEGADAFNFYPEVQTSVQYELKKWKMSAGLFYKFQGRLPNFFADENGNLVEGFIQEYHFADLTVSKRIWKDRLQLTIGSKNIFNVINVNRLGSSGVHSGGGTSTPVSTGRTYFASLKFDINQTLKTRKD